MESFICIKTYTPRRFTRTKSLRAKSNSEKKNSDVRLSDTNYSLTWNRTNNHSFRSYTPCKNSKD